MILFPCPQQQLWCYGCILIKKKKKKKTRSYRSGPTVNYINSDLHALLFAIICLQPDAGIQCSFVKY